MQPARRLAVRNGGSFARTAIRTSDLDLPSDQIARNGNSALAKGPGTVNILRSRLAGHGRPPRSSPRALEPTTPQGWGKAPSSTQRASGFPICRRSAHEALFVQLHGSGRFPDGLPDGPRV